MRCRVRRPSRLSRRISRHLQPRDRPAITRFEDPGCEPVLVAVDSRRCWSSLFPISTRVSGQLSAECRTLGRKQVLVELEGERTGPSASGRYFSWVVQQVSRFISLTTTIATHRQRHQYPLTSSSKKQQVAANAGDGCVAGGSVISIHGQRRCDWGFSPTPVREVYT